MLHDILVYNGSRRFRLLKKLITGRMLVFDCTSINMFLYDVWMYDIGVNIQVRNGYNVLQATLIFKITLLDLFSDFNTHPFTFRQVDLQTPMRSLILSKKHKDNCHIIFVTSSMRSLKWNPRYHTFTHQLEKS